jgi:hypothetical protein
VPQKAHNAAQRGYAKVSLIERINVEPDEMPLRWATAPPRKKLDNI